MRTVTRGRQPAGAGPPLRSGPLGDCRGRPCGKLVAGQLGSWPVFHRRNRGAGGAAPLSRTKEETQKGLAFSEASTHDSCRAGFAPAEIWRLVTAHGIMRASGLSQNYISHAGCVAPGCRTSSERAWPASRVPHPVSWTQVWATRLGVARTARGPRVACDRPASRGASTGCSARRTRRRRRARRRDFERPGRRRPAP